MLENVKWVEIMRRTKRKLCMQLQLFLLLFTVDTVPVILSLSVEYQVTALQDRCESFLTKTLEHVQNHESDRIDIPTLLRYIACSTKYNLSNILEQVVNVLIRYDVKLLKQAGVKTCSYVSEELWTEILEKRNSLMTTFLENVAGKGNYCKLFLIVLPKMCQLNMFGVYQFTCHY